MSSQEVRKRGGASAKSSDAVPGSSSAAGSSKKAEASGGFGILDIFRVIVGLLVLTGGLSWIITGESFIFKWRQLPTLLGEAQRYLVRHTPFHPGALLTWDEQQGPVFLTDDQLSAYDGSDPKKPIYVGLNGSIYDVSASPQTYGPGGGYAFFAGRDATRGFLTGCFQEDLTPDLRGVEEMYIPIDDPNETLTRAEQKIRRERDVRLAKKQIAGTLGHWEDVFSGKTGRPYFFAGTIKREEGWLEKLPKRPLCAAAAEGRPKREDAEKAS